MSLRDLPVRFLAKATELEPYSPGAAVAWRAAAAMVEAEMVSGDAEILTLEQASIESNYSVDHLRHLVAAGSIENAGSKGRPRIRRGQLPRKPKADAPVTPMYDATADAMSIETRRLSRRLGRAQ